QRVLVNGAGGGVGTFAVQIAKWLGAHVTAVTRAGSVDLVRSIGADEVIDHDADDFTSRGDRWDVIFDIGGNRPFSRCRRVMKPDGILVAIGGPAGRWLAPAGRMLQAVMLWPLTRRRRVVPFVAKSDAEGLSLLAGLPRRSGASVQDTCGVRSSLTHGDALAAYEDATTGYRNPGRIAFEE
ncbi:MAG TPA: zinc-binding dehydrogenase, partial [Gemmatimonadales bacterium]|nr:zinc-binding dehydrogenase [Gemmatimonadales bacterium]